MKRKLLVVVDYQKDFVDGALGFEGASAIEDVIAEKIAAARRNGHDVVFTLDTHGEDYLQTAEGKWLPVAHCLDGTPGHALYGRIAGMVRPEGKVFTKNTLGCDRLYEYCKAAAPYDEIELVGVVTQMCVLVNAALVRTAQPEARVIVEPGATASFDPARHTATFDTLQDIGVNPRK